MSDPIFVDGLRIFAPKDNQPEFVKAAISINKADLMRLLHNREANDKGEIRIDVKQSRKGSWYCQVNDWKPDRSRSVKPSSMAPQDDYEDDIPF